MVFVTCVSTYDMYVVCDMCYIYVMCQIRSSLKVMCHIRSSLNGYRDVNSLVNFTSFKCIPFFITWIVKHLYSHKSYLLSIILKFLNNINVSFISIGIEAVSYTRRNGLIFFMKIISK